jgi:hypothetical protein
VGRQLTIDELAERLALSRSTIYYWVRDLPILGSGFGGGWPEGARRKGNLAMQRKYRLLWEAAYEQGMREYEELAADPTFRDFVCLYIAEGYMLQRNSISICNSDPAVMQVATRWIRILSSEALEVSIQYHIDQDLNELRGSGAARLDSSRARSGCNESRTATGCQVARGAPSTVWWRSDWGTRSSRAIAGVDGWLARRVAVDSTVHRGVAKPGIAPHLGCGGRRFESGRPDFRRSANMGERPRNAGVAGRIRGGVGDSRGGWGPQRDRSDGERTGSGPQG